jgi:hypothetical protein
VTAPTVLRAAYARTAAATGAFPAVTADMRTADAVPAASGPLARVTGELVRLTGAFTELPGGGARPDTRATGGLAALFALASAAVSDEHTLDVATQVWRTGSFPVVPGRPTGPRSRPADVTTFDLFGGQSAAGVSPKRLSYRHRQQAGLDALMAIATPQAQREADREEHAERPVHLSLLRAVCPQVRS